MGIIYKLEFSNGKAYIGLTTTSLKLRLRDHRKATLGKTPYAVHRAWLKYGEPRVTILAIVADAYIHAAEIAAIREHNTKIPHGYNLTDGGEGCVGMIVSEITREKLRKHNLGKKKSPEALAKLKASLMGHAVSDAARRKIGEKNRAHMTGKKLTPEAREKLVAFNTGRTHAVSDEARAKMRSAKLGTKQTAEHRAKIAASNMGRVMTAETREKLAKSATGRKASDSTKAAQSEAAKRRGISPETRAKMNAAHALRRTY